MALGSDKQKLGDFAEYISHVVESVMVRKTILEAIKWAQEHHNTVGDIIAGVADSMNARQQLMNQFGFCMEQAQAIIDMRLRMFCDKERKKISEEIDSLRAYFINYENVLW